MVIIYLGGATPTIANTAQLGRLNTQTSSHCELSLTHKLTHFVVVVQQEKQ